jgi:hypothetical protein
VHAACALGVFSLRSHSQTTPGTQPGRGISNLQGGWSAALPP